MASTRPLASTVAVPSRRWYESAPVALTLGVPLVTSMTIALLLLPPNCRMRPGWNIAPVLSPPVVALAKLPASVTLPLPAVLTQYMRPPLSKPNRRPSGVGKLRG